MIVMKFGGSSVKDLSLVDRALRIAENALPLAPVLVSSAMGDTTDHLEAIAQLAGEGNESEAVELLDKVKDHHLNIAGELSSIPDVRGNIESILNELSSLVKGLCLLRECTDRSRDAIISAGELLSTRLIAARAEQMGMQVTWLDSRDFIRTDSEFTHAAPDFDKTNTLIKRSVKPKKGQLLVAQGFIARAESGATTTLGRGGSDYTAAIIGRALKAKEIQIWTDVNGIMTSDPRVVQSARTVERISYAEAAELAYFGAKVVHPSTMQPAIEGGIPVVVKNTGDESGAFTAIEGETGRVGITALAMKSGITVLTVTSSRMLNAVGFLSRIFSTFEKYRTAVDLVATSEVSVSMTIEDTTNLDEIVDELSGIGRVSSESDKGILCLVGQDLWKDSSFVARVFTSLKGTPVRMISLGSSDINLSLVVPEERLSDSMKALHAEFFE